MFKKVIAVIATGSILIFGGAIPAAEAAAKPDMVKENVRFVADDAQAIKIFQNYFSNCFGINGETPKKQWKPNKQDKQEQEVQNQDKQEQEKQEAEPVNPPKQEVEQTTPPKQETEQNNPPKQNETDNAGTELSEFEQQVVELTNQERAKNGLSALKVDQELSKVAREKSRDMAAKNYFDHQSPTYGSPFDMMRSFGITYQTAGENIAKGQRTPQEVVQAWMNSSGHRANILNANYTHIGVGFVEQGNHWTQQFIGK